jgi:hypothetical protein
MKQLGLEACYDRGSPQQFRSPQAIPDVPNAPPAIIMGVHGTLVGKVLFQVSAT